MTRVLVVEDEESFSDALSYMLRREGFDAVVAGTGPEALAEFDRGGADIVLLDLMLPGMSGIDVCRSIRGESGIPIVMLTGTIGAQPGADALLTKPFEPEELLHAVARCAERFRLLKENASLRARGLAMPRHDSD